MAFFFSGRLRQTQAIPSSSVRSTLSQRFLYDIATLHAVFFVVEDVIYDQCDLYAMAQALKIKIIINALICKVKLVF